MTYRLSSRQLKEILVRGRGSRRRFPAPDEPGNCREFAENHPQNNLKIFCDFLQLAVVLKSMQLYNTRMSRE